MKLRFYSFMCMCVPKFVRMCIFMCMCGLYVGWMSMFVYVCAYVAGRGEELLLSSIVFHFNIWQDFSLCLKFTIFDIVLAFMTPASHCLQPLGLRLENIKTIFTSVLNIWILSLTFYTKYFTNRTKSPFSN